MDNKIPHILIVDDDANLLSTMSDILKLKGYTTATAQTGAAALAQLEGYDFFNLALLDLRLEDMSGLKVLEAIKARSPETECILLTGHASQNSAIEAIRMGVYGFFQKPFDMGQVLLSIQRALEKTAAEKALRESERFARATVDALSSHLAILDETGVVLAVNRAWREFAKANSSGDLHLKLCEGANYLAVCDAAIGKDSEEAAAMAAGIRAVISGRQEEFSLEYPCHYPEGKRWFTSRVTRFPGAGNLRVAVAHEAITERKLAEVEIQNSEKRFRALIENGRDSISLLTADGTLLWESPSTSSTLGYAPNQFAGRNIFELLHPDDRDKTQNLFAQIAQTPGKSQDGIFRLQHGDGTWRWIEATAANMLNESSVRAIVVNYRDITGRRQAEENLRRSESLFASLFHANPARISITRFEDSRFIDVNETFLKSIGYTREEVVGHTSSELNDWVDSQERIRLRDLIKGKGRVKDFETQLRKKSGDIIDVLISAEQIEIFGETCILSVGLDITGRKQAQEARRKSELQFRALFELSPDAVMLIDPHDPDISWPIIDCNETACRMNGYRRDELIGHSIDIINLTTATRSERDEYMEQVRKAGTLNFETLHRRKDGTIRPIEISTALIMVGDRELLIGIDRDVSERKLAEEKLAQTEKRFRALIEKASDGVALVGIDGNFSYVSPSARVIFGYGSEDPIDITPNDSTHPDDLPKVLSALSDLIQYPAKALSLQYRFKCKDGSWLWIESTFTNLLAEPSVEAIVINFRNITDRRQAEETLHESEEQSRLAHEAAELGIWRQDFVTNVFHFDKRAYKHYDVDELAPSIQLISSRVHRDDLLRLRAEIATVSNPDTDGRLITEYRVVHRDGSIHWLVVHARVHFEEQDGKRIPNFAAGTSQDITTRKEAEQKLARRTDQLRLINEATRSLNLSLEARHVYEVIYTSVSKLMPCDTLFISSYDPAGKMISLASGWHDGQHMDTSQYEPIPLEPEGSGTQSQVIRSKEALLVSDFQARLKNTQVVHNFDGDGKPEDEIPEDEDIPRSALIVPLLIEGEALGVIQVFSYRMNAYTEDDLDILNGFSSQAAISLSNAHLYEHVQQENLERRRAEAALAESEKRFRSIFETSGMGIFESTLDGHIINVNAAFARMFGFKTVSEAKQGIADISEGIYVHPEKWDRFVRYVLKHPGMASFENEYRRHDGTTFTGELKLQAMQSAENQDSYLFGYVEDITARKQAEIEIRERTEDLKLINALNEAVNRGDSLDDVLELFTRELRQISVCKDSTVYLLSPDRKDLVMQHIGLHPTLIKKIEKLIGGPLPQIQIPIKEGGYFHQALQADHGLITTDPKTIQGWMQEFTETKFLPATVRGAVRKLIPQIYHLLDIRSTLIVPLISDKKVIGLLDISSPKMLTEKDLERIQKISGQLTAVILRERANEALLESENRYRTIFDGVQDAIFIETKDGRVLEVNNSACQMYGYERDEFLKKTILDFVIAGGTVFAPHLTPNGSSTPIETVNRRANGEQFPIEISGGIQNINGEEVLLTIVRDITRRKKSEEALRESEQKYRSLFDEMLSGVAVHEIICDPQGKPIDYRFLAINPAFEKMTGLTFEAVIGRTALEVMPGTESYWIERYGKVALTREPTQFENYSGELGKYFEVRAFSPEKGIFATIFNDVTERKQAEEALSKSRLLFSLLIENLPQNIYAKDADGRFIFANQHYCATEGRSLEELVGKTDFELHPLELAEKYRLDDRLVAETGTTIEHEEEHQPLGKEKFFVQVIKTPFFYSEGKPAGVLGIFWDITERKQVEQNIRQRVKELELLYQSGLVFSQMLNPREIAQKIIKLLGEKLDWHHTTIRLIRGQDELELLAFDQPGLEDKEAAKMVESHFKNSITHVGEGLSGWALQQAKTIRLGDVASDSHYVATYPGLHSGLYVPLRSGDRMVGVISIESEQPNAFSEADEQLLTTLANQAANAFENARLFQTAQQEIIERKRVENLLADEKNQLTQRVEERTSDLSRVNADLAHALRVKDEFLASMSHELRTPLTGILGLSEVLQLRIYGDLNEKQGTTLKNIEDSGRHLLELINDILDLSKIEAGKLDLQFAPYSLGDICQGSLQLIKGMAQHKSQHVHYTPPTESIMIRVDARRLKQVLVNLLSNAIKFTSENGELGLEVESSQSERKIRLTVWDKGIGIKPEDINKLFKPFTQLDSGLAREYSGTGLGLSLVRHLTELHNGGIEVESAIGQGSRFTVILPWSPENTTPIPYIMHRGNTGSLNSAALFPDNSKSPLVMYVDDNEMVLQMVADFLESKQYHVIKVRSGIELLERAAEVHPDIMLVDIQMPGIGGMETIRRIRAHSDPLIAATPVIAVTALAMPNDREHCLRAGANDYMSKPLKLNELAIAIQKLLERKQ